MEELYNLRVFSSASDRCLTKITWHLVLGEWSIKMRNTKVSHKGQVCSEKPTIYIQRFNESYMSRVINFKSKPHIADKTHTIKASLYTGAYEQITIVCCNE